MYIASSERSSCESRSLRQSTSSRDITARSKTAKQRTALEVLPRLAGDVVVVPRELAVELPVLLVDPGNVALVLVVALAGPLLPLVDAATTRGIMSSVRVSTRRERERVPHPVFKCTYALLSFEIIRST